MDQFKKQGWCLTESGFNKISENGKISNHNQIMKIALNTDLRDFGGGGFLGDLKGSKFESPNTGLVLQILKVRNIAAPKSNQESKFAPRLLKIQFTDGSSQYSGIEIEHISTLNLDTKPGTKVFFKPGKVIPIGQDLLLIKQNQIEILGGHVADLVEKWEMARKLSKYAKGIRGITQAPPWIAFGQKIDNKSIDVNTKKSLINASNSSGKPDAKEDNPFDSQRKEAIAEVAKMAEKRVFSEGARKLENHNLRRLMEKGFDEESAKNSLRTTKNDFGKALSMLKRYQSGDFGEEPSKPYSREPREDRRGGRRGGGRGGGRHGNRDSEEEELAKPSQKLSLFDFIGDKLPIVDPSKAVDRFENNISSSFASRQPRSDEPPHRSGYNGRNNRDREPYQNQDSNYRNPNTRRHQQTQPTPHQSSQHQNYRNQDSFSDRPQGGPSFTQRGGRGRDSNTRPNQGPSRSYHQEHHHQNKKNFHSGGNNQQNNMNNLVQDTQQMTISNKGQDDRKKRQTNGGGNFPTYDPNRIPGFQNRAANEAAIKLLLQQHPDPPPPQAKPVAVTRQLRDPPPATSKWQWKAGDRCLAKYWEDGRYYNAEITGVSGRTCVVNFMEYGNFEEVLKDDCLPITNESNENFVHGGGY